MTRRYEFSKSAKLAAWDRCRGLCENCGSKIRPGNGPHYHHRYKPATEPGSNTLDNCQVLCERPCHKLVTAEETIPMHARTKRIREKSINARRSERPFPKPPSGYNPWTRRMEDE